MVSRRAEERGHASRVMSFMGVAPTLSPHLLHFASTADEPRISPCTISNSGTRPRQARILAASASLASRKDAFRH